MPYLVALFSIALGAVAQLFLKKGATVIGQRSTNVILDFATNVPLLSGLVLYGLSAVLWIFVLTRLRLSVAYPLVSLGYIFTTILAVVVLHEKVHVPQMLGLGLIIAGICVMTVSSGG